MNEPNELWDEALAANDITRAEVVAVMRATRDLEFSGGMFNEQAIADAAGLPLGKVKRVMSFLVVYDGHFQRWD